MKITGKIFRLAANQQRKSGLLDAFSNEKLSIPRGNWVRMRFALFDGDPLTSANLVTELTNIVSATLTLRKTSASGALLYESTILAADFDDAALTHSAWLAKTSQHFTFLLEADETNWTIDWTGGVIYFVLAVDTTDEGPVTIQSGLGEVYEDGSGVAGTPPTNDPTYRTDAQNDARFALLTVAGKYRIKADGSVQLWNATQSLFHSIGVTGAAGAEQITIDAGEA